MIVDEKINFESLRIYQIALEVVDLIYDLTNKFPREELYGLISQLRRAAFSIVLNIAEGQGRLGQAENKQFLLIARGSIYEIIAILEISSRRGYISLQDKNNVRQKLFPLLKQINSLIRYLRTK